jgi:hypothetical protein
MDMSFSPKPLTFSPPKVTMAIQLQFFLKIIVTCTPTFSTQTNSGIHFQT